MKRKTNISVQDNLGTRVSSNMIVGDKYNGYASGDILDANATAVYVKERIDDLIGGASEILDTLGEIEQKFSLVDQSISDIQENQESADLATAASLNDLNSRLGDTALQAAKVDDKADELTVAASLNDLNARVSSATSEVAEKADELTVAAAIALLNKKISILFTNIDNINNRLSAIENQ